MHREALLVALFAIPFAPLAAGCGGGADPVTPDAMPFNGTQPPNTTAVNFVVDDRANQLYAATAADGSSDLRWKGAIAYDANTRLVTFDENNWATGPWPPLYDDGPWTSGGHEPESGVAGDHQWSVTVFATPPSFGSQSYDYGVEDEEYENKYGNGWLWPSGEPNGYFIVRTGKTEPVDAMGLTLPAFGTTDVQVTIDTTMLSATNGPWNAAGGVAIECDDWVWASTPLTVDGTGKATLTFSTVVGTGHPFDHSGLFSSGNAPEFNVVIGGRDYQTTGHDALQAGITAAVKAVGDADFTPVPLALHTKASGGDGDTYLTIP